MPVTSPAAPGAPAAARESRATVHLLGAGKVGRALLRMLPETPYRLTGLTDSRASLHAPQGLDPASLADHKSAGRSVADLPGARQVPLEPLLSLRVADAVVDCTRTDPSLGGEAAERALAALTAGSRVIFAAKHALLHDPESLSSPGRIERTGLNAVLGGTGLALRCELEKLRRSCRTVACVPNATTTAIVAAVEGGRDHDEALGAAREAGLIEGDPALDLDGTDAAIKLVVVASLLGGRRRDLAEVERPDVRDLDPELLRRRSRDGLTTRLVGRILPDGSLALRYEALPRGSTLAVGRGHVVYAYELQGGHRRVHLGDGLGPDGTAQAILADLAALCRAESGR